MKARPETDGLLLLRYSTAIDPDKAIAQYMATGEVQFAEPNYLAQGSAPPPITPNDPHHYPRQWSHFNDGTFNGTSENDADIDMREAWEITTGSVGVVAAILDSGFKLDHPDVAGRIWNNSDEIPGNGIDDDGNGRIDDHQGWDFVNNDNSPMDDHGHGTNVAGLLGATGNNGIGYAGVDWNCKLMICKVLNSSNSATSANMTAAFYYAVDNGADVVNMSIGGSGFSAAMQTAINYAYANDVVIVACMMNFNNAVTYYPAGYSNVIAVGATDTNDERVAPFFWDPTSGSNFGTHIDLVAPGNYMYGLNYSSNTNYNSYWGGTSQASPIVCGVAGLIKALDPTLGADSIRSILMATADDQVGDPAEDTPGWDQYHGAGRLNAYAALDLVRQRLPKSVAIKVFLGGPYDTGTALMHDSLRAAGLVPLTEPYSSLGYVFEGESGQAISPTVLAVQGNNAIVDWVVLELRPGDATTSITASAACLVQRDGDVVDLDGFSVPGIHAPEGNYHIAIRHRNHLSVLSPAPSSLSMTGTLVHDFTAGSAFGSASQIEVSGIHALWPGNTNGDGEVKYTGVNNDRDVVLVELGGVLPTNVVSAYDRSDVNLDGRVKYTGIHNDRDRILVTIGGTLPTAVVHEQLP
ncbi:MAG: S8 family serine peptidase [Flavobacteriales bacterium]|nr:MAG: S8 family serine peptidase [Flavobacteriales bacterium]